MSNFNIGDRVKAKSEHARKVLAHFREYWKGDGSTNEFTVRTKMTRYDGVPNICISQGSGGPQWPADFFELIVDRDFKAGDRVQRKDTRIVGLGTVFDSSATSLGCKCYGVNWDDGRGNSNTWTAPELLLVKPAIPSNPAIVALVVDGQPRPSSQPYVHDTIKAATIEAERLSVANPGQVFAVYERVTARIADKPVARVAA